MCSSESVLKVYLPGSMTPAVAGPSVKIRIVFHGWTSLPVQAKLATRQPAVVARFGWGEATDEPSPLHFAVPGPAREDSRPTEFACCTSTRQVSADLCFTNGTRRTLRT
jgi:hypothetical protein